MPNRVIRTYYDQRDNFIRVTFRTESNNRDNFFSLEDPILKNIRKLMTEGFTIGTKLFKFLHYSNSQLRSHSCWFICETDGLNYEKVMKSLGDFKNVKTVSKNASRKGQAFSSTIKVGTLALGIEVINIKDVTKDKYVFTDGCGFIDQDYLNSIVQNFFGRPYCSAIQIRMGGYKGMLLGYDRVEPGVKVYASASMKKFDYGSKSDEVDLEVIRLATFMPGYLSKQILIMLWANGVHEYKLIDLQSKYVEKIISYYKLENIGPKYVFKYDLMQSIRFIQDKLYNLHKKEYHYERDPFIKPLIKTI